MVYSVKKLTSPTFKGHEESATEEFQEDGDFGDQTVKNSLKKQYMALNHTMAFKNHKEDLEQVASEARSSDLVKERTFSYEIHVNQISEPIEEEEYPMF